MPRLSALGQKLTSSLWSDKSAKCHKQTFSQVQFGRPLFPKKQTSLGAVGTSV